MKKADNFDASKWLVENKITFQSRLNEGANKYPFQASPEKIALYDKIANELEKTVSMIANKLGTSESNIRISLDNLWDDLKDNKAKKKGMFIQVKTDDAQWKEAWTGNALIMQTQNGEGIVIPSNPFFGIKVEGQKNPKVRSLFNKALDLDLEDLAASENARIADSLSPEEVKLIAPNTPVIVTGTQSSLNENSGLASKIAALPNHHTAEDTDEATLIVGKYAVVHYDESDEGGEDMYVVWDNTVNQDEIGSYDDVPEFESEDPAEVADWLEQNASRLNEAIGIGPMGATSQKRFTAASGEEGSSSPDEFSLSVVTNPLTGRKTNFNYKLKNVEFEKKKVQELFGNLFKSSPKIKFTFERTGDAKEKKATMEIKLKDDKFVLANSTTTEDITGSIPDEGEAKKFIDYLLNKSQWGDDLKQTFENIEQALTPASLK